MSNDPQIQKLLALYDRNIEKAYRTYLFDRNGQLKTGREAQKGLTKYLNIDFHSWLEKQLDKRQIDKELFYQALIDSL